MKESAKAQHEVDKANFAAVKAVGIYLMTDIKKGEGKTRAAWLVFAVLSAVFTAATSLLANAGIDNVGSNLATAIRTAVVLVMAWLIVFCRKEARYVKEISGKGLYSSFFSGLLRALRGFATITPFSRDRSA